MYVCLFVCVCVCGMCVWCVCVFALGTCTYMWMWGRTFQDFREGAHPNNPERWGICPDDSQGNHHWSAKKTKVCIQIILKSSQKLQSLFIILMSPIPENFKWLGAKLFNLWKKIYSKSLLGNISKSFFWCSNVYLLFYLWTNFCDTVMKRYVLLIPKNVLFQTLQKNFIFFSGEGENQKNWFFYKIFWNICRKKINE